MEPRDEEDYEEVDPADPMNTSISEKLTQEWEPHVLVLEENVFGGFAALTANQGKCQLPSLGLWCSLLLVLLTLYAQVMFTQYMIPLVAQNEYEEKMKIPVSSGSTEFENASQKDYNLFKWWRNATKRGQKIEFSNKTQAEWVCTGESFSYEEDQMDKLAKYVQPAVILFVIETSKGEMFAILAIAIWAATIVANFRKLFSYLGLLTASQDLDLSTYRLGACVWDFRRNPLFKGSVLMLAIARIVLYSLLGYQGVLFLAYVDNLSDFILNSVALAFVYDLPELMFQAFASTHEKTLVAAVNDENSNKVSLAMDVDGTIAIEDVPGAAPLWVGMPVYAHQFNGVFFMAMGAGILSLGIYHLAPYAKMLDEDVYRQMCTKTPGDISAGIAGTFAGLAD